MPELRDLTVEFVSLVDRAAVRDPSNPTEPQRLLLWKSERGATNDPPSEGGKVSDTELTAALQKAEQERDEARDRVAKLEKKLAKQEKPESKPEEINKNDLPAVVRKRLEKLEKAEQEANERLAKAEQIAKVEQDLRITREFVAKAESQFAVVGGDAEEFGALLKSCSEKLAKEEFETLETRLRAANEHLQRNSHLLKEMGRGGDPVPAGSDTVERIAKAVEDIRKADPGLSEYEAHVQAMRKNPELQREYLAGVR